MIDRFNTILTKTHFAPAKRLSEKLVYNQHNKIAESKFLDNVLTKIPFVFLILNYERQIVYSNDILVEALGYDNLKDAIGLRPGEMFRCVNSDKEEAGCGTSINCRYCGAVQAILESQEKEEMVIKECRLYVRINSEEIAQDYEVVSKPFYWSGERFFMLTLNDISSKKRREHLEKVFFHDLINKAGSLSGLVDLIKEGEKTDDSDALMDLLSRGMKEMLKDISYQKKIQQAENGILEIYPSTLNPLEILYNIRGDFREMLERQKKHIEINQKSDDINIVNDEILLNRVLTNLVKNALEASLKGDTVKLSFKIRNDKCFFIVSNPAVMSEEVKSQIFQRSFSTKGSGRGIGTYSIKLFTESYMKGKVSFDSDKNNGTTFKIELPLEL